MTETKLNSIPQIFEARSSARCQSDADTLDCIARVLVYKPTLISISDDLGQLHGFVWTGACARPTPV
jgi:hypothetical protein